MFVVIGAGLAGLYLILRDLIPLVSAWRSGVIRTRGTRPQRIERAREPDRFKALCRNRYGGIWLGLLAIAFGMLWAVVGLLALVPAFLVSSYLALKARKPRPAPVVITPDDPAPPV